MFINRHLQVSSNSMSIRSSFFIVIDADVYIVKGFLCHTVIAAIYTVYTFALFT